MKKSMQWYLEENNLRYCESDYWNNPLYADIEREIVRFRWGDPKYKGHSKMVQGVRYFDDFVMTAIRHKIEDYKEKIQRGQLHERVRDNHSPNDVESCVL